MQIGDFMLPDVCPESCQYRQMPQGQGGPCQRCPVFNCSPDDDGFRLLEPEDYRLDWAEQWHQYFNGGHLPKLRL